MTLAGSVTLTSDGVTVIQDGAVLSGITVQDGEPCNMTGMHKVYTYTVVMYMYVYMCYLHIHVHVCVHRL